LVVHRGGDGVDDVGGDVVAAAKEGLASQVCPANLAPVDGLAKILAQSGHADQARTLLDTFASRYPDQRKAVEAMAALWTVTLTAP
jgi:hypothetical protein